MTALKVAFNLFAALGWLYAAWGLWHQPEPFVLILATCACIAAALSCVADSARSLLI